MDEHRKNVRINDSFKISYKVISPPDGWGNTVSINISRGGIAIPINHALLPGIILELKIDLLNNTELINATGEIVWIKEKDNSEFPYVAGLKFIDINLRDRDRIHHYISKKSEEKLQADIKWLE